VVGVMMTLLGRYRGVVATVSRVILPVLSIEHALYLLAATLCRSDHAVGVVWVVR
jgi:hypothetical protein